MQWLPLRRKNPSLKGVLPKDYARPSLDKHILGELIDLIGTIGLGDYESRSKDILGRVYEYFLGRFASQEGKGGGEFYTPQSVVKLLVEMIEADLVDCMIALPGRLFYTTQIPACLWFVARNKKNSKFRDRRGQTLFIDARKMGYMIDRRHRELSDDEIGRIAQTYHAWRKDVGANLDLPYQDIPGFCKSATIDEIRSHGYVLTPGRYVGAEDIEDDDEPFDEKMKRLMARLEEQFKESAKLEEAIKNNLRKLGF